MPKIHINLIIIIILLYTLFAEKGYSKELNNNYHSLGISNLYPQNASNAVLNKDSATFILLNANSRKFENDRLSSGKLNIRTPLLFNWINVSFDFGGNFSDLYNNYSAELGILSKITNNYTVAAYYSYDKFAVKNLNDYNRSGIALAAGANFNNIYSEIQLLFKNSYDTNQYKMQAVITNIGYDFSNNFMIDFTYAYDFKRKIIFGVSGKSILLDILQLRVAYYINPNRFIGGVAVNLNKNFTLGCDLDKSENLPYNIAFQLGVKF